MSFTQLYKAEELEVQVPHALGSHNEVLKDGTAT